MAVSSSVVALALLLVGGLLNRMVWLADATEVPETPVSLCVSVAVKLTVRLAMLGVALVSLYTMARATSCTSALVALALKVKVQALLFATPAALAVPICVLPAISLLPLVSSQMALPPGMLVGR